MLRNNASCSILDLDYAKIDPHTGENADFSQLHSAQVFLTLSFHLYQKSPKVADEIGIKLR